jgi:hypothetical protein
MSADAESAAIKPPQYLYKYLDRYGLDAIANVELKVTPPDEFNDPFEFCPVIEKSKEEDAAYRAYLTALLRRNGQDPTNAPEKFWVRQLNFARQLIHKDAAKAAAAAGLRIVCFSANAKLITQWSHYADGHRGLVLEMDTSHLKRRDARKIWWWREIDYRARKPQPIFQAFIQDNNGNGRLLTEVIANMAAEKSPQWESECEWRLVLKSNRVRSRISNGRVLYFLPIEKVAIRRVILGIKASKEFEREIRKAAHHHGIGKRVVRAELDYQARRVRIPE